MKILSSSIPGLWLTFARQHMDRQDASCPPGIYLPHQVARRSSDLTSWRLALGLSVYQNRPFANTGFFNHAVYYISIFFNLFLNWRIIALQNFVFCQTSTWISHRYTYVPSFLNLPPHPTPLGWYRAPVWIPWDIQQIPIACLFYIRYCKFPCDSLRTCHPLLPSPHVHKSDLHDIDFHVECQVWNQPLPFCYFQYSQRLDWRTLLFIINC